MRSKATKFNVTGCDAFLQEVRTRMPFRYGSACLTAAPVLHVRVEIETKNGKRSSGIAADCLPPLWFDKDPSKDYRKNVEDQLRAYRNAREIYSVLGSAERTAFELWEEALPRIDDEAANSELNGLTAAFGGSFFERAIIDAICRAEGISFLDALKRNALGFDTAQDLPETPVDQIWCRHTIGLADPITTGEISDEDRLDDGLPQALEEDIEFYGLRYFKVKVCGDQDRDLARLSRMAALFAQRCQNGYSVTLDGNEQYRDLGELEKLIEDLRSQPYGPEFLDAVLFIEQPLHRDKALDERAAASVKRLAEIKPVLIDESDDSIDAFSRAVEIGYQGVSHKNCKGIFKSLINRHRVVALNEGREEARYFQSAEDLANVAVVPLQADLASLAALGIDHAERNGHHYYRGLDHLPTEESTAALAAHGDLYEDTEGSVFLRVVDGSINLASVVDAVGYGFASAIALEARTPLDEWSFDRLELEE